MKWKDFTDQLQVATLLNNSILNQRVAHAYLFVGSEGVGKKQLAIHYAKALLCPNGQGDSCDDCHHCQRINSGNHPDLHIVTLDGASIKIDQVRQLQKTLSLRAVESSRSIYIIEQAEKMTLQAANSLLKVLEEPVNQVTALLLTEHSYQILPTILSRCQVVNFASLSFEKRVEIIKSEGFYEPLVRNACEMTSDIVKIRELCQAEWFAQYRNLVIQLSEDILDKGSYVLVTLQEKLLKTDQGNQALPIMLDMLTYWYRDLLLFQIDRKSELVNIDQMEAIQRQVLRCSRMWILKGIEAVMEAKYRLGRHANPQLSLERMVIQLQEG